MLKPIKVLLLELKGSDELTDAETEELLTIVAEDIDKMKK